MSVNLQRQIPIHSSHIRRCGLKPKTELRSRRHFKPSFSIQLLNRLSHLTYVPPTNSTNHSLSWEAKRSSYSKEIPHILKYVGKKGWACGLYGWGEGGVRVLVGKPEGKRQLGRPRRRWVDNIRTDFPEVGCGYMDWIGLVQDRDRWWTIVSAVVDLRVPWNAGNFLTSYKPVSFSGRTLHHGVSK